MPALSGLLALERPSGSVDVAMRVSRAHQRTTPSCRSSIEARRHSNQSLLLEVAMCTKIPYLNRWLARQVLKKLRASGRAVRSIHPYFEDHPGCWHVTRQRARDW